MVRLWYATSSSGKVVTLDDCLHRHGFEVIQRPVVMPEPRLDRVEDMAMIKAMLAFGQIRQPLVASDSGFCLYDPKLFARGFANFALDTTNLDSLVGLAAGTYRRCEFRHALAYTDGESDAPKCFVDCIRGTVARRPCGDFQSWHLSAFYTIFIPDGEEKTLAELSHQEYTAWQNSRTDPSYAQQFLDWYQQARTWPSQEPLGSS